MTANYVLLEKITVGAAGASSVTFSGIPQTGYTDLVIKISTRDGGGFDDVYVTFNGSTTGYSNKLLFGTGASAGSSNPSGTGILFVANNGVSTTANTFANAEMYLPNYTSSNNKSASVDAVDENNATTAYAYLVGGLWANSAAITSISINAKSTTSFVQYSTFYLYGVAKLGTTPAIVPYATGGDTIMTDGTYWYHTFTSSGTFTPAKALSCDYLVVAGGGGGGSALGAGGGAGGVRSTVGATGGGGSLESKLSLGISAYTVTIGAGGAGSASYGGQNFKGSNSVFSTITSAGGGAGTTNGFYNAVGGSGGGGSVFTTTGGAGTTNQGYAGGNGYNATAPYGSGGGGGAGAVGQNYQGSGSSVGPGAGGVGIQSSINGTSTYYGGGGGSGVDSRSSVTSGSAGGLGGGGTGGNDTGGNGTNATPNTGGGGGGGGYSDGPTVYGLGGNGGSGIVIVRYLV